MNRLYTFLIAILLLPAMSFAKTGGETVYSLFSQYSLEAAGQLEEPIKSWPVSDVKASKGFLSFKIKGFPFIYKWVGKSKTVLTLNGHAISYKQLKNKKLLKRRVLDLLKPVRKKKSFSFWNWIVPQAHAMGLDIPKLFSLLGNVSQPSYSKFWSKLYKGDDFTHEKGRLASFLGTDVASLFGGTNLLSAPWPAPVNIASPRTIYVPDAGESISVQ